MTLYHTCIEVDEMGDPLPSEIITCADCGRSWCRRCKPTPASLCPFQNGDPVDHNPVIDSERADVDPAFVQRVIRNVADHTSGALQAQIIGTIRALQAAADTDVRAVLIDLARTHPVITDQVAEILHGIGVAPMEFRWEVQAEVIQVWNVKAEVVAETDEQAREVFFDMLTEAEIDPSEGGDLAEQNLARPATVRRIGL